MTQTTKQNVVDHILTTPFYEEVLKKYLTNIEERNEFRQELWLILLEMNEFKLINYYDNKCLQYIYIGIINNQIKSKTSPWHKKFRAFREVNNLISLDPMTNSNDEYISAPIDHIEETNDQDIQIKKNFETKLSFIYDTLKKLETKDAHLMRDIAIFKMNYLEGLSYRKIAKKTNISLVSIWKYVNNIKYLIELEINKNKNIKNINDNIN